MRRALFRASTSSPHADVMSPWSSDGDKGCEVANPRATSHLEPWVNRGTTERARLSPGLPELRAYPHLTVAKNVEFRSASAAWTKPSAKSACSRSRAPCLDDCWTESLPALRRAAPAVGPRARISGPTGVLMMSRSRLDATLRVQTRRPSSPSAPLGTTTIYVPHTRSRPDHGNRIAVMDRGVLQQVGHPGPLRPAGPTRSWRRSRQPRHEPARREPMGPA